MGTTSKARRERRALLAGGTPNGNVTSPAAGSILAGPMATQPGIVSGPGGGGWAVGGRDANPASGSYPAVNPFLIPKQAGLNVISQTYPSNYFVEWDLATWRIACDRVMKMGFTPDYATLTSWAFESSPFIQSLFRTIETSINSVPFYCCDARGNIMDDWTQELCNKPWQMELKTEIAYAFFWGFSGLNFDPIGEQIYKYPMQDIDPLNRMLRQSTFAFYDGVFFEENDNLLFVQPSTSTERFLGWMQPITRQYIQMNLNDANWVAAGRKLAFPIFTLGYPEGSDSLGTDGQMHNPYREEAEAIARDIGPGKAVVYPYTKMPDGTLNKTVEIEFEQTGASQKAHSIYLDFNEEKKNEIRELILGGTLTADVGDSGSRALGEVQERKLQKFLQSVIEFVVAQHNGEYKRKLAKFYKNFPKDLRFDRNRAQQLTIEEIVAWSGVVQASGKRFTPAFFEANGLPPEFLEDAPEPTQEKAQPLSKKNDGRIADLKALPYNLKKKLY